MPTEPQPVLHIVFARQDEAWVRGVLLPALGLAEGEYVTQSEYELGEFRPEEIERAVRTCRYTLLVASRAAEIDQWVDFAGQLAQTVGIDDGRPRLLAVTRDFTPAADRESKLLALAERCKLCLDCRDPEQTRAALAKLAVEVKRPLAEAPSLECPYPGLRMFGEGDPASSFHRIDLFFGRDAEGDAIIDQLRRSNRALLVGPSGCGKSSLVNARVLPVLGKGADAMAIARLRLGPHPDTALRNALHALDPRLGPAIDAYLASKDPEQALPALVAAAVEPRRLVHIDQLEQVFLNDADEHGGRARFFAQLAALTRVPGVAILLSMRADFYGDLMRHPAWDDFKDHRVELAPLRGDALRLAITRPAEAVGVYVESDLVERLVQETDLDRAAEALPLLQVTLVQLWTVRQWRYLSLASYERIVNGNHHGLEVVLARHANDSMQQLPPPLRPLAHRVLIDLIHLGEGRPDTRRRRSVSELRRPGDARGAVDCVLEHLSERRLIAISADAAEIPVAPPDALATAGSDDPDDPARHVDLAHDALISGWPTLAGWIAERRSDLLTQRRLEARPGIGGLLSASELADFTHWITTPTGQELGATKALRALVRRSRTRRRLWRWGISFVAVVMLAAANIYWGQVQRLSQADRTMLNLVKNAMEDQAKIQKMSGTLRDAVLNSSRELLSAVAATSKGQQRIAWADTMAQADLAFELGEVDDARELYQDAAAAPADAAGGDGAPSDDLQRDRAVSLERRAHLEAASGNLVDARRAIQDAIQIRERLGAADPASADRRRELAASYDELGDIAVTADSLDAARTAFVKALAARKALAEVHPGNAAWQRELSIAYEKLGDVTATIDDPKDPGTASKLDEARRWFDRARALLEALARREPKNRGWQRDLLVVHGKLGEVAASAGKADDARREFKQAFDIAGSLAEADPGNADWQRASLVLGGKLCDAAVVAGQLEQATTCYEGVLEKQRALAAAAPADARLQRDIANLYRRLSDVAQDAGKRDQAEGWRAQRDAINKALADEKPTPLRDRYLRLSDVLVSADQFDEALGWIDRSFATVHALTEADPANPAWQHDLSVAYDHRGEVQWVAGEIEDARASFNQAYSIQRKLVGTYPTNRDCQRDLAMTLEKLGELDASTNKPEDARARFEQALEIHTALAAADPEDLDWQQRLAATYEKLSDLDVAAHRLKDAGPRLDQALKIRAALAATDRANADWQRALSMVQEKQGELAMATGKPDGARASFDQALAIRRALVKTDPGDDRRQFDLGGILTKLALIAHDSTAVAQYAGEACIIYSRLRQRGVLEGGLLLTRLMAALEQSAARIATLPAH